VLAGDLCPGPPGHREKFKGPDSDVVNGARGRGDFVFEDETAQACSGKVGYSCDDGVVVIVLNGKVIGDCNNSR